MGKLILSLPTSNQGGSRLLIELVLTDPKYARGNS